MRGPVPYEHERLQHPYAQAGNGTREEKIFPIDSVINKSSSCGEAWAIPAAVAGIQSQETRSQD